MTHESFSNAVTLLAICGGLWLGSVILYLTIDAAHREIAKADQSLDNPAIRAMERLLPYLTEEQKQKLLEEAKRMEKKRGEQ